MIEDGWRLFTLRKAQEDMLFGYLLVPFSCRFFISVPLKWDELNN